MVVVLTGEVRNTCKILVENLKGKDHHLENMGTDGRKILEWVLKKYCVKVWIGFICLSIRTSDGLL
jgi:hypothetical protein